MPSPPGTFRVSPPVLSRRGAGLLTWWPRDPRERVPRDRKCSCCLLTRNWFSISSGNGWVALFDVPLTRAELECTAFLDLSALPSSCSPFPRPWSGDGRRQERGPSPLPLSLSWCLLPTHWQPNPPHLRGWDFENYNHQNFDGHFCLSHFKIYIFSFGCTGSLLLCMGFL